MGSVKVQKDFIIKRKNWFRFWEISEDIQLPLRKKSHVTELRKHGVWN